MSIKNIQPDINWISLIFVFAFFVLIIIFVIGSHIIIDNLIDNSLVGAYEIQQIEQISQKYNTHPLFQKWLHITLNDNKITHGEYGNLLYVVKQIQHKQTIDKLHQQKVY